MFKLHFYGNTLFHTLKVTKVTSDISKLVIGILTALSIAGCQTYKLDSSWPTDMPKRQLFIDGYLDKRGIKTASESELGYHLGWIKRFYQGTTLYPVGWLSASQRYLGSIESPNQKTIIEKRLETLGVKIANEWAQDNSIRLINNSNIATWASAMRTAAERQEHQSFLDKVEKDVDALVSGKMSMREISYERYFAEESYDDF